MRRLHDANNVQACGLNMDVRVNEPRQEDAAGTVDDLSVGARFVTPVGDLADEAVLHNDACAFAQGGRLAVEYAS